ncbi:TPA: phage tail tape measure protein [Serratia fonticola]|nr:phage tail tape measure protein [Serratia fonticola]
MADLSVAVEVQKVRASQGEKAADLYAASHESGTKWTNEQRKAIEASAVELATWTQKADEAVRKQREMADALKELTDAARKYRDDAAASEKTRGMGQRQRDQFDERQQVERIYDKSDKGTEAVAARDAALGALNLKYKEALAAEADWMAGVSAGMADWVDEASDYAGQAADATKSAMSGMVNNITDMLNGNKASWKDWSISVLKEIEKVLVNAALVNSLKSLGGGGGILGALGGLFGGGAAASGAASAAGSAGVGAMGLSTSFAAYDLGGFTGLGAKYEPAGVVHKGEFVFTKEATERIGVENLYGMMRGYANGGLVSPSPVAGGSLGVRPTTASQPLSPGVLGGGSPLVNVVINIDGNGNVDTQATEDWGAFAKQMGNIAAQESQKVVNRNLMPGMPIWKAIKG